MNDFEDYSVGTGGHYHDDDVICDDLEMGNVSLKISYEKKEDVSYEHNPPEVINCLDILNHFDINAPINLYKSDLYTREFIASFILDDKEFFTFRGEWWLNNNKIRNIKNTIFRLLNSNNTKHTIN